MVAVKRTVPADLASTVALHRGPRCRAADVEGAHRELRARLADRLRGDHADRLADVDQRAAAEVAAVALGAHALARVAGQRRAHLDLVDAERCRSPRPRPRRSACRLRTARPGSPDGPGRSPATRPRMRSRSASTTSPPSTSAFIETPFCGAAIVLGHHQVLRHVDQAPREVARVRGLQRRIGQALAGAVRGDEVLQHVQAFAEVRGDRRLDDRAVGLGHQAAHAGELADLRRGAARAGVGHHVDGVERLLLRRSCRGGSTTSSWPSCSIIDLADLLAAARPDVDHLVVALARGHQARGVLRSRSPSPRSRRRLMSCCFCVGIGMSFTPNRDAGARGDA